MFNGLFDSFYELINKANAGDNTPHNGVPSQVVPALPVVRQVIGGREEQQDVPAGGFHGLKTDEEMRQFLTKKHLEIAAALKDEESGSTAALITTMPSGTIFSYGVGDSMNLAVVIDEETGAVRNVHLLNELHRGEKRTAVASDYGGSGAELPEKLDLREYTASELVKPGERLLLISACDGILDGLPGEESHVPSQGEIEEYVKSILDGRIHPATAATDIADILVPHDKIEGDNTSASVADYSPGKYLLDCDGHFGSAYTAREVANELTTALDQTNVPMVANDFNAKGGKYQKLQATPDVGQIGKTRIQALVEKIECKISQADLVDGIHGSQSGIWYVPTNKHSGVGDKGNEVIIFNVPVEEMHAMQDSFRLAGINTEKTERGLAVRPESMYAFNMLVWTELVVPSQRNHIAADQVRPKEPALV